VTPLQVDVTGLVLTGLRAQLPLARCVTETPNDLEQAAAAGVVKVIRSGGGDDGHILDTATMTLDCFWSGGVVTEASREFAYQVVGAMYALLGQIINGATVTRVRKIGGPVPLPYDNPSVRRQALTFRVAVKTV
jgi:hypothetical protein